MNQETRAYNHANDDAGDLTVGVGAVSAGFMAGKEVDMRCEGGTWRAIGDILLMGSSVQLLSFLIEAPLGG